MLATATFTDALKVKYMYHSEWVLKYGQNYLDDKIL